MEPRSVYDVLDLGRFSQTGVVSLLPFHPLRLAVSPTDDAASPVLVIGYDFSSVDRVVKDVPRLHPWCTHVKIDLVSPDKPPISAGFGAACFATRFDGEGFIVVNPEMHELHAVFAEVDDLSLWQKIRHRSLKLQVQGHINNEEWRYTDNAMSIALTHLQAERIQELIEQWRQCPPSYQVRSFKDQGYNCSSFTAAVVRAAGIKLPKWWGIKPWPFIDSRAIDRLAGRKGTHREGEWLLQSRGMTQQMQCAIPVKEKAPRLLELAMN